MIRGTIVLLLLALAAGCASGGSARPMGPARVESRSVPGLGIELVELVDGRVHPHPPDAQAPDRVQEVDTRSTLRLSFTPPPPEAGLAASPEWASLEAALRELASLLEEFQALSREARQLPAREVEGTRAFRAKVAGFGARQQKFVNGLVGRPGARGLLAPEELNTLLGHPQGPYAGFAAMLRKKLGELESRAKAFAASRSEVLVTVRARLDPEVGPEQWLQVPGYWEKTGDAPGTNANRSRAAEIEKLRAEFEAAQRVSSMIGELRAHRGAITDGLSEALAAARGEIDRHLRTLTGSRSALLDALVAQRPPQLATAQAGEFWDALASAREELRGAVDAWETFARTGAEGSLVDQVQALAAMLQDLGPRLEGWKARITALSSGLPEALAAAGEGARRDLLENLEADLETAASEKLQALLAALPRTADALKEIRSLADKAGPVAAGVDALPADPAAEIPRPPDDLPRVDLDLTHHPITPGDDLRIDVSFYDKAEYEAARASGTNEARPKETVAFTSRAVKSGWIWSGDVIFARRASRGSDLFDSSAAVSYERHWRDRDRPDGWLNRLDPGLGFHAATLNFDPQESAEVGAGVSASLFGGLFRLGIGYDISVEEDQTYWFFGFGLISALDRVRDLGGSALDR